jgi:hypothetical protein
MAEQDNVDDRESVFRHLKETLNQKRQLEVSGEGNPAKADKFLKEVDTLNTDTERRKLNNSDLEAEIKLKKSYGIWFLVILACQLLVMNIVFILVGKGLLNFKDDLTLQLYMGGTMTEVFGLVLVVTKYLFKRR